MNPDTKEEIELDLLLEAIWRVYGYDFRDYSRASLLRRTRHFVRLQKLSGISHLIPQVMDDAPFFERLVSEFSVTTTEMFRDPWVFNALIEHTFPHISARPFAKIWHAGCATGQEVYSMAILLEERGWLDRVTHFGTDFSDGALEKARLGRYRLKFARKYTRGYQQVSNLRDFNDYYTADDQHIQIRSHIRNAVTFANHNLVTDGVFGEMDLILCRNVLIYFNQRLQDRVLRLLTDSLTPGGFLCLGDKETLRYSSVRAGFEVIDSECKIYRKKVPHE